MFCCVGEAVIPKRGKYPAMKIFQRFHFSSALKRMSVIAGYSNPGSSETHYVACVKVNILKHILKYFLSDYQVEIRSITFLIGYLKDCVLINIRTTQNFSQIYFRM